MRRTLLVLVLLLTFSVTALADASRWEYVIDGREAVVTYHGGSTVRIEFEGQVWTWTYDYGSTWSGSMSGPETSGDTEFAMAVMRSWERDVSGTRQNQNRQGDGSGLVGMVLILAGLLGALSPQTAWYLSHGWKFRNAEPSDLALFINRAGGVLAIIIGLFMMFA